MDNSIAIKEIKKIKALVHIDELRRHDNQSKIRKLTEAESIIQRIVKETGPFNECRLLVETERRELQDDLVLQCYGGCAVKKSGDATHIIIFDKQDYYDKLDIIRAADKKFVVKADWVYDSMDACKRLNEDHYLWITTDTDHRGRLDRIVTEETKGTSRHNSQAVQQGWSLILHATYSQHSLVVIWLLGVHTLKALYGSSACGWLTTYICRSVEFSICACIILMMLRIGGRATG